MKKKGTYKILILGASGFIGNAIYKELCSYFNTYGTYYSNSKTYIDNQQFFKYDIENDDIYTLLEKVKPQLIISSLRGNFSSLILVHQHISEYLLRNECKIYFLSSANVFDAYSKYPSYELDKTLSASIYGRFQIKIENMLLRIPQKKMAVLRVPIVFGNFSPRVKEIKDTILLKEPIEVFPNLIVNVTNIDKLVLQIHFMLNKSKTGIFHLGSNDLIHHEELIQEIVGKIGNFTPVYKRVFTTNEDRYLAVLSKTNTFPKNLNSTCQEVIDAHYLTE
ncbi:MAG: sugar nucleotide-binding protein [Cellulophaga sp.]